jgi:hypothetical protein
MMGDELGGAHGTHGRYDNCMKNFDRKSEGKWPHGRPKSRREDYIKICRKDIEWKGVDWISLVQNTGL